MLVGAVLPGHLLTPLVRLVGADLVRHLPALLPWGFCLQVPGMGAQTLLLPYPSHWYSQSSLYWVVHSVSVYGSYSVLYWSTHTLLYTVLQLFSYTVWHSCLVVALHSLSFTVWQTFS